ncbi:hypothetical protein QFZ22_005352 [Streptomyces canus]|uniref:MarR family transcriptional regulator n=1 Tax=Streptomyces canus TaxID=58343 RepID=A0AAW8FJX5_9ACTN|nr:hypothetical protein [Streptomyces canus]
MPKAQFAREADMLEPIVRQAPKLVGVEGKVFFEVESTSGIPDVVLVSFDEEAIRQRRVRSQGLVLDLAGMSVLFSLQKALGGTLSPSQIANQTHLSAGHISSSVLPQLARSGHVEKHSRGKWAAVSSFCSLATRICTIEAKIRDWRSGYHQTLRHGLAADEAWLVLDAEQSAPALAHRDWFSIAGIGLASLDQETGLESLVPAKSARKQGASVYRELLVERAAALCMRGKVSGPIRHVFGSDLTTSTGPDPRRPSALETVRR